MKEKFKNNDQLREMAEALANIWLTKQQVKNMFNITNLRSVREKIAIIAEEVPVLSMSTRRGYKVCTAADSDEDLRRADKELALKIEALKRRRKPLQRELKKRSKQVPVLER